ncbi:hypothetical protein HGO26_16720 [Shewanella sp. S-1]|uniref:MAE-28990/MAE-18760-like HEPN domain-containing protein n=1 Tax=Shewanella oncorhynchi TaxID=2726434 RepID=A0ABX1KQN1_9GAMM|nr:MAE_28990/MAE_18760 family HEPN-like nuclease [Shewanella oncorhynchi]NLQ24515.1 hypothetical protein [Shewanella oncorhynchi]
MDLEMEDFESRVNEIELYFQFMEQITATNACIGDLYDVEFEKIKIDSEVKKIFKANLFLLLYNLIESSFKSALVKLIQDINGSNSKYGMLIPEIRKIWFQDKTKFFSEKTPRISGKTVNKLEYYFPIVDDIFEFVLSIPEKPEISGNLDGQSIRKLLEKYGILSEEIKSLKSEKLVKVKSNRNDLAHGDISFSNCGRDLSVPELKEIKDQVINYMRVILNEFNRKIENKYYLIS